VLWSDGRPSRCFFTPGVFGGHSSKQCLVQTVKNIGRGMGYCDRLDSGIVAFFWLIWLSFMAGVGMLGKQMHSMNQTIFPNKDTVSQGNSATIHRHMELFSYGLRA
jgi:hypothetical protein